MLTNSVFFKLLLHADFMSQCIVWILMSVSIACWAVFIFKLKRTREKIKLARLARKQLSMITSLEELAHLGSALQKTPAGLLIVSALSVARTHLKTQQPLFAEHDRDKLFTSLERAAQETIAHEGSYFSLLKMSAETGPLIGLFGTVWGLIHSFDRISVMQTADIATVAPGIAEALLVTMTGLFVAIPAMVQYHVLRQKLAVYQQDVSVIADMLEGIVVGALSKPNERGAHGTSWTETQV